MQSMASDEALDEEVEPRGRDHGRGRFAPSLVQVLLLVVAVAFLTSVTTAWWVNRAPTPNATDVGFYDDMTTHHYQAIGMAISYLSHGTDPVLRLIAGEINASQNGDIRQMQTALQKWHRQGSPGVAMEWMNMPVPQDAQPGMATPAQLEQLSKARGRELDDLFSRLMIAHHEGGIHMANAAVRLGDLSRPIAAYMATTQRDEIGDMTLRRKQLGLPAVFVPPIDQQPAG
jgi:uncharacterized protein (DUF305 family)